jgi:hypothetical protein
MAIVYGWSNTGEADYFWLETFYLLFNIFLIKGFSVKLKIYCQTSSQLMINRKVFLGFRELSIEKMEK